MVNSTYKEAQYTDARDRASLASTTEIGLSILASWGLFAWGLVDFASHIDQTGLITGSALALLAFLGNGVANRVRANRLEHGKGKIFRTPLHEKAYNLLSGSK
ncbi:MAG TPA: hypothetical protein VF189_01365 [Patescibacteria group bacterium]